MPSRFLKEIPQDNAIKKFKTANTSPYWSYLAANRLALSGRDSTGSIWPQVGWFYLAATEMVLCTRKFTPVAKRLCQRAFARKFC
jgi:hypothetical protein